MVAVYVIQGKTVMLAQTLGFMAVGVGNAGESFNSTFSGAFHETREGDRVVVAGVSFLDMDYSVHGSRGKGLSDHFPIP